MNILLQNARLFKGGVNVNSAGVLGKDEQIAESIGAVIDINDRYGFNTKNNYQSDSGKLDYLIQSMGNIVNNKLETLIEKGEY